MKKFSKKYLLLVPGALVVAFAILSPRFLPVEKVETKKENLNTAAEKNTEEAEVKSEESGLKVSDIQISPAPTSKSQVQGDKTTNQQTSPNNSGSTNEAGIPIEKQVTLKIETGGNIFTYKVLWEEGISVYEILDKAHVENNFSLKSKWFAGSLNSYFVQGIHGNNCECWEYEVNGKKPSVGASVTKVSENDIIIWKAT